MFLKKMIFETSNMKKFINRNEFVNGTTRMEEYSQIYCLPQEIFF